MPEEMTVTLVAELTFASPVAEPVLRALASVVSTTLLEPGCLEYVTHVHVNNPRRVLFYERWQDQAALDAHNRSAHLAEFRAQVGPRLAGVPERGSWKRLG
jgi:quinol monooxygenase YgiN